MGLLDCNVDVDNLGIIKCNKFPQMPKLIVETPPTLFFTPADAVDPTKWQAKLKAAVGARIYLWPEADNFTDKSEAFVYQTTPLSMIPVRPGRYQWTLEYSKSLCYHKAMYSHSGKGNRIFVLDIANQLLGTLDSLGNFRGLTLQLLQTEKLIISNGTIATVSPVHVVLADSTEIDQNGAMIDGTFLNSLYPLTDVVINVLTHSAAILKVQVLTQCDNTPVIGLVKADFVVVKASDGTAQVILASTDNLDGTYTFTTASAWVSGSVDLVAATALSLVVGAYETEGPTIFAVP